MKPKKILSEDILRYIINEATEEEFKKNVSIVNSICDKLNAIANSVEGANAIDQYGYPIRISNYKCDTEDCGEYRITYDIVDTDNESNDDCEYFGIEAENWNDDYDLDIDKLNDFYNNQSKLLAKGIKFANAHREMIIPKNSQKKLDKLNADVNAAIQQYDEDIMLEDGDEITFTAKNFRFERDGDNVKLMYDTDNGSDEIPTEWRPWFTHTLGIYIFNDDELNGAIKYVRGNLRRGIKYYREYNPDWDDDEEARNRFMNSMNSEY